MSAEEAPDRGSRRLGYALVVSAAAAWGTWPLVLRRAHAEGEIAQELVTVVVIATLVVGSAPFLVRDRSKTRASVRDWLLLAWLGVSSAANIELFFAAYARARVAVAVLTHCLAPLVVALASPFLLREAPRARTFVAVTVALGGLALVLAPSLLRGPLGAGDVAGAALGAASALFYASNVIVSKKLAGRFSATELVVLHGFVALPILALAVPSGAWAAASPRAIGVVVVGGFGPGALAGLFFNWGLRRVPATHAAMLTLLEPTCAVLLGVLVLHERLDALGVAGIVLVLGASLAVLSERAPRPSPESM